VWYNKVGFSQLAENGEAYAEMYYILPLIDTSGAIYDDENQSEPTDTSAKRINDYFLRECMDMFTAETRMGKSPMRSNYMLYLAELRQTHGDDLLPGREFSINAIVTENTKKYYSVWQTSYWLLGATGFTNYYGSTFDRISGERLTIKHFIDGVVEEFFRQLTDEIALYAKEYEYNCDTDELYGLLCSLNMAEHEYCISDGRLLYFFDFTKLMYGPKVVVAVDITKATTLT
jgi:hypothetical protein